MQTHSKLCFIRGTWLALAAVALMQSGCLQSSPHVAHSEGGTLVRHVDGTLELRQGANAKSITRLDETREDGTRLKAELGTSRAPVITVPPAPPYGQYAVAVIGALALIGGGVMAFKGWPKIGGTIAAGGFVVLVIGLTAGSYGWAWALLAAAVFGLAAWALYSGYKSVLDSAKFQAVPQTVPQAGAA